ncbi:glutamine--fructose-6-phosphate aminotransferase [Candidatus Woesebacteria bacterium RBG_19FT_COMBO_42_9]|uniref:Glutamine--fructose-6-phosphate aminotransferase [isomerizing] n=1 Tax=Candidatus Woesebacteria bacterium RBG_16_42_24 TaxID=1802485 RepID=A0A1F7XJR7_9BACT|nr:MAG: glutamine--fructose-6-phosphate aminotransferase [Candidatus Woesebacteria bacterium RBG_16_42_24]OGM17540.1 MAG: glutamine--fructose-6-phosphate aminotransferase [Candidatus Woesebacteria bacterium RBG_19FT_COMBO_42_9]OGM67615.1 MAG: glutamine--fructose-6-phosphate aminotransferase [Candidatus Woesebacteria bacterium RIFCSPLOWO2_01_FULL_43_11]
MCGVFGYSGEEKEDLAGYILEGLKKLEYRGYDSSGIAVFKKGKVRIIKEVGELANLRKRLKGKHLSGNLGIGHTRWATHGGVTRKNAHPHTDCLGKIAVVHNGIMENYEEIKQKLLGLGHKFKSETDTEIFPHLIEEKIKKDRNLSFSEAVRLSFNQIEGLNAVCACCSDGEIVAFRKGSPLVAGLGEKGNFVSSDIPGLSCLTRKIVILEEGEGVSVTKERVVKINSKTGKRALAKETFVDMEEKEAARGNFPYFLIKEIFEQPEVVARVAASDKKEIKKAVEMIKKSWGTYFTACGTAAHSGLAATYMFSEIAKRHVNFAFGSEFPYFNDFLVPKSLLIAASQSGETMDTLEAVRAAKKKGAKVLSLVNVPSSTLTRLSDKTILLKAGPERAVLSTKSYIAKLSFFLLFAYAIAGRLNLGIKILQETSKEMVRMLKRGLEAKMKKLAKKLSGCEHIYIIGRGVNYATALEGALKIKEASYIHAEGFPAGELKHGVIALIEPGTPCFCIIAKDRAKEAVLSNAMELKSRGGYIIGISSERQSVFDVWIQVPEVGAASPIVSIIPMQLLAYHLTLIKGYNPDRPRNLAKSVTVR